MRTLARAPVGVRDADELYLVTRRYTSGQTPADRIAGTGLSSWAIAAGAAVVRRDWAITRVQEAGGDRSRVLADISAFLVDRLWGEATDPETGDRVRDEFEGSSDARGRAVFELAEKWKPIESFLDGQLQRRFDESFATAIANTPTGAQLVTDSDEIKRLRTPAQHYGHRMRGDRWGDIIARGSSGAT